MLADFSIPSSDISLENNFSMGFHTTFPVEDSLERLERGMTCICTNGSADVEVDFIKYHIEKGAIFSAFPMQVVEQKYISKNFSLMYIACSREMLQNVLFRFPLEFEFFLKENPVYKASEEIYRDDIKFLKLIKNKLEDVGNICRNEIITNLLRVFYLNIYNGVYRQLQKGLVQHTRKMEIMRMFIDLIMEHYNQSREVAFYAKKLNITPKYLSIVTQEERGHTAKKVIDDFMITEIKLRLNSTSKSIQEISEALNFPDQSFFCKYFKHNTGFTPKQYRNE